MCRPNTKRTEISPTKLCECELFGATEHSFWGAAIAQWLERQARDLKVPGSSPGRNGGRIFFSRVNFLCWLLFWYPFYPCVTAVACKRSQSFCRLQLNTHTPYLYGFEWSDTVTWCMVEWCTQNLRWNAAFHVAPAMQQPQSITSTPLLWILIIHTIKGCTHSESHANVCSESAWEQRIALYESYE